MRLDPEVLLDAAGTIPGAARIAHQLPGIVASLVVAATYPA